MTNLLIQQLSIVVSEQSSSRIDLERINNALIGATNAVMLVDSMNSAGLASVDRESLDTLINKFQLNNLMKTGGIEDE